jgi:hypothetical protein
MWDAISDMMLGEKLQADHERRKNSESSSSEDWDQVRILGGNEGTVQKLEFRKNNNDDNMEGFAFTNQLAHDSFSHNHPTCFLSAFLAEPGCPLREGMQRELQVSRGGEWTRAERLGYGK